MAFRSSRREVVMVPSGSPGFYRRDPPCMIPPPLEGPPMPPTPRDRLRTALAHREPDRPPFDLGSTQVTSIASRARRRLRAHLGLPDVPGRVSDRVQQLDHVEEDLLRALEVDTRGLWPLTAR